LTLIANSVNIVLINHKEKENAGYFKGYC